MDDKRELRHNISELQKKLNKMRNTCNKFKISNDLRLHQIRLWSKLFDKMIKDGRLSKDEFKQYSPKREEAKTK